MYIIINKFILSNCFHSRPGQGQGRGRRRGVGKGGRKLGVRGGLVDKNNLRPRPKITTDVRKARKAAWQKWLNIYTTETEKIMKKTKKENVKCPECHEKVMKTVFISHRTKNCLEQDPRVKMASWDLLDYV